MLSSFLRRSSSRHATKLSSETDPNFRWRLRDFRDDLLLPSLDEELFLDDDDDDDDELFLLIGTWAPILKLIRLLVESRLMEPLEHSTSSEKDTLELVLDWRLEDDTDEDDTDDLSDLMGTTTGDSVLQFSHEATLSLASLGAHDPSSLQKLSFASRL